MGFGRIGMLFFVVISDETVVREMVDVIGMNLPEEERPYGVTAHYRVEERSDLCGVPDEFALDRRQKILMRVDTFKHLGNWDWWLEHATPLSSLTLP